MIDGISPITGAQGEQRTAAEDRIEIQSMFGGGFDSIYEQTRRAVALPSHRSSNALDADNPSAQSPTPNGAPFVAPQHSPIGDEPTALNLQPSKTVEISTSYPFGPQSSLEIEASSPTRALSGRSHGRIDDTGTLSGEAEGSNKRFGSETKLSILPSFQLSTHSDTAIVTVASGVIDPQQAPTPHHLSPATHSGPTAPISISTHSPQAHPIVGPERLPDLLLEAQLIRRDNTDRMVVQLDPPELGRVTIDFRFDGKTLQHVAIVAETPEALRQLRLLHFELSQALEKQGLAGGSLSFAERDPDRPPPRDGFEQLVHHTSSIQTDTSPGSSQSGRSSALPPDRLDVKL